MKISKAKTSLSSLSSVPLTDDTRSRLMATGLSHDSLRDLTEMGGQSLLCLSADPPADNETPACYRNGFDPEAVLCGGCVFQPSCWQGDLRYLHALVAGNESAPAGVPGVVLQTRLDWAKDHAMPPKPPSKKPQSEDRVAMDPSRDLAALGFDSGQIMRMTHETRAAILAKGIRADGVSILKSGDLKQTPPKKAPSAPTRKPPPPPPPPRRGE